jgi:hypothetical protein
MSSLQYAIPLAIVDGRSLADLAHGCLDSGVAPQMQDLLVCVQVGDGSRVGGGCREAGGLDRQVMPGRNSLVLLMLMHT